MDETQGVNEGGSMDETQGENEGGSRGPWMKHKGGMKGARGGNGCNTRGE